MRSLDEDWWPQPRIRRNTRTWVRKTWLAGKSVQSSIDQQSDTTGAKSMIAVWYVQACVNWYMTACTYGRARAVNERTPLVICFWRPGGSTAYFLDFSQCVQLRHDSQNDYGFRIIPVHLKVGSIHTKLQLILIYPGSFSKFSVVTAVLEPWHSKGYMTRKLI